jgi:hypothetical protein
VTGPDFWEGREHYFYTTLTPKGVKMQRALPGSVSVAPWCTS